MKMNTRYLIFFSPGGGRKRRASCKQEKTVKETRVCFARISNINCLNKQQRLERVGAKSGCKRDRPFLHVFTRFRIFPSPSLPSFLPSFSFLSFRRVEFSSPLPSTIDQKYCQILYFQLDRGLFFPRAEQPIYM